MTPELVTVVAEHSMGNYRVMMNTCGELLYAGLQREAKVLDEKLFFELFTPTHAPRAGGQGRGVRSGASAARSRPTPGVA